MNKKFEVSRSLNQCNKQVLAIGMMVLALFACNREPVDKRMVKDLMNEKISRLYEEKTQEELAAITYGEAFKLFANDELEVLATRHWMFDVNVPVVVSVMRNTKQEIVPFWLISDAFTKTKMTLNNEMTTYEVWQKSFDAGTVGLGINGFENNSMHYFVSVAPQNKTDELKLSNFFPANQYVGTLDNGAFTYHDWDELVLENVPEKLKGQKLLTTIRGRGTESHLENAFRTTNYPSSIQPDQVMLTWSSDPASTIDIQWRTNTDVSQGKVEYREKGSESITEVEAEKYVLDDLLLMNDRLVHRFTAHLSGLKPGTTYEYRIVPQKEWTEKQQFSTETAYDEFSWLWFGDIHHSPQWGKLANEAFLQHPDVSFVSVAGDLVGDGLHRNQWDDVFEYSADIISQRPFMNVLGNHDNRSGLGAHMYEQLFSYPKNGPDGVIPEHTYSFSYKNALFLMIDATSKDELQTGWIEEQLKNTTATWKLAMFHFPPYNWEEPYLNIQKLWGPLFDKYHVDMVFGGHIHYYMRSNPMKGGQVVDSYNNGTAYVISIGIPSRTREIASEPYAAVQKADGQYFQYMKFGPRELSYSAVNSEGEIIDSLILKK
ncbi:metallophosphoesterase family protein [Maribellus sp. CM-23]|uniref:purple acid phosphatase family protein n=1 Tax=Maribellus sp. CM-23 TaxID=2781026 RepID=UPI001F30A1C2|nr:metallophosphoesterase family protein [Maribellus sp. CM-23]MCE4562819.1 metallophosphoesterase family protein [Maribellus sp. CM-23]